MCIRLGVMVLMVVTFLNSVPRVPAELGVCVWLSENIMLEVLNVRLLRKAMLACSPKLQAPLLLDVR